jgi:bacillithiol system protein YtxJ
MTFARSHPEWPLYVLKVIEERDPSDAAAQRLGVPHASPQAFVIRQGHCVWHASHHDITTNALDQQAR